MFWFCITSSVVVPGSSFADFLVLDFPVAVNHVARVCPEVLREQRHLLNFEKNTNMMKITHHS